MDGRQGQQLPIGYWIKRVDELLTRRIDAAQRSNGLSRLEWQALNALHERGATTRAEIVATLQPFAAAGAIDDVLLKFAGQAWVQRAGEDGLELTPAGRERHAQALASQQAVRRQAMNGISESAYAAAVAVLQRMAENLEPGDTEQS